MKTIRFLTAIIYSLAVLFGLTACSELGSVSYQNADKYSVGNASFSETIEKIDIDWPSGNVNIVTYSDNSFSLSEKIDNSATDDMRVHWWLDGTTLRIKFTAPGIKLRMLGNGQKELTVTVPKSIALSDITVNSASANVKTDEIKADRVSVSTASGEMDITCNARQIQLNSASGSIKLGQIGKAEIIEMETASGKIESILERADKATFDSASGTINICADEIINLSATAASGRVSCMLNDGLKKCDLRAVSGNVTLTLPEDADFTAEIDSTSGDFYSDFSLKKEGDTYICGDGSAEISVKTTSGDISVSKG